MKFIGHLDMMRYFQKAMRRADIDIAYSQGFRPHQIMSFAAPLGVGITSDGEYLDIEVYSTRSSRASVLALNESMVDGICVFSYLQLPDNAKPAMSVVAAADYRISYKAGCNIPLSLEERKAKIREFYDDRNEILITKKTKKSEKLMDLKKLIYDFCAEGEENPCFFLRVCTGSTDNVKPELVLDAFYRYLGLEFDERAVQIHRLDVYAAAEDGSFISLGEMGEEIA